MRAVSSGRIIAPLSFYDPFAVSSRSISQLLVTSRFLDREWMQYGPFPLFSSDLVNYFEIDYHLCPLEHARTSFDSRPDFSYRLACCLLVCVFRNPSLVTTVL